MPTQEEILKMIKESGEKNEAMLAQAAKEDGMEIRQKEEENLNALFE